MIILQQMALKMKGLLQSEYDIQTYADYIAGKRKYFTIEGMMIEKHPSEPTLHEDPVPFLRNKYTSTSFIVSTKVAKDYIKTYEMDGGIICATDGIVYDKIIVNNNRITQPERVGILAYIKNNFLFIAYIWKLPDFEKIEDDPEKVFLDSFKVVGKWDYAACRIVDNYNPNPFKAPNGLLPTCNFDYQLHVASEYHSCEIKKLRSDIIRLDAENELLHRIETATKKIVDSVEERSAYVAIEVKKLQDKLDNLTLQHEYTKQISKNLESMLMSVCSPLMESSEKNEKLANECLRQCSDLKVDNEYFEQYCDDLVIVVRKDNKAIAKRLLIIEIVVSTTFICGMISLIVFYYLNHQYEPRIELLCIS